MDRLALTDDVIAEILADVPSFVDLDRQGGLAIAGLYWKVASTGVWGADVERGDALAVEAIEYCRQHATPAAIVFALAEMIKRGTLSNIEIGFLSRMAQSAMAGSLN